MTIIRDIEITFTLPEPAHEALRIVARREGQTQAGFIRSAIMPLIREELRAIEARLQKKPPESPPPRR